MQADVLLSLNNINGANRNEDSEDILSLTKQTLCSISSDRPMKSKSSTLKSMYLIN